MPGGKTTARLSRNEEAKSLSQEQTFTPDLQDRQLMEQILLDQAEQVGWELRKQKLKGLTVHLKVRYPDFTLITRSQTLPLPTDAGMEIYRTAVKLLRRPRPGRGRPAFSGSAFPTCATATPLVSGVFLTPTGKKRKNRWKRSIKSGNKFGPEAIKRASLLERKKK